MTGAVFLNDSAAGTRSSRFAQCKVSDLRTLMSADFSPEQFWGLTPEERIRRCRQMAALADQFARQAGGRARDDYVALAAQWRELADEMEALSHTSA